MTRSIRKNGVAVASALAIAALTLSACSAGGDSGSGDDKTITIGLLAPLTGQFAADGEDMKQGAELAIDELNEAGGAAGYTFELKTADVQDQTTEAVNAGVEQMISDSSVGVVITGYASPTNFEIDKLAAAQMPYLIGGNTAQTEAIVAKDPDKYPTIWSVTPDYALYNSGPVDLVVQWEEEGLYTPRDKSAYIIKSDNPYSAGIADGLAATFEENDWTVGAVETIPFGAVNDWQTQLAKIRQTNPDYVINTDYQVSNEVSFMEQFTQNPTQSLVFLQYGPNVDEFLTSAGDAAEGVLYNNLASPVDSPDYEPAQHLRDMWEEAYGTSFVPSSGMNTYVETMLYAKVLEEVGSPDDKLAIGKAIGASDTELANGRVVFDEESHLSLAGDEYVPLQSYQIIDGQRELIAPAQYATAQFVLPPWMNQ